jgi:uncharacterized protein (TIGR03437 family)
MGPFVWLLLAAALVFPTTIKAAEFTTYLGDANPYSIARLLVDSAGNTLVAGSRTFNLSQDPFNPKYMAGAYALRLDASGRQTMFAGFSGKGNDFANDIAVDGAGNVYIAGLTTSPDFTMCSGVQRAPGHGFIAKFNPDGSRLLYCTYFPELIAKIVVDNAGNMYVAGSTTSRSFPVTAGLPAGGVSSGVPITSGAFLTKIAASGDRIIYSMVLAGGEKECGCCSSCFTSGRSTWATGLAVDGAGNAYLAGSTDTLNLPTTPGAMVPRGPGAFVAKVNASGTSLGYLTYIGNTNYVISPNSYPANLSGGIAVDALGNVYLTGGTMDPHFPATAGAYQRTYHGPTDFTNYEIPAKDGFVLKLNPTGTAVVWATYLGGTAEDATSDVQLDTSGNLWVRGTTRSPDFPNQQGWGSGTDFVAELSPDGATLPYSARYPNGSAQRMEIGVDGLLHIAGGGSGIVSAVAPSPRPAMRAFGIANAAYGEVGGTISPGEVISLYGPHIGPAQSLAQPNTRGSVPTLLGGVQVFINDLPAPLLYVSDSQINAVTPFALKDQASARVRIVFNGATGPDFSAVVVPVKPQIFQDLSQRAAALNADGTVNSPGNPAKAGTSMSIWATGTVPYSATPVDGVIPSAAEEYQRTSVLAGTTPLYVDYSGAAPGIVAGVVQINFRLPANFTGENIAIMSGGVVSSYVSISVAP